MDAQKNEKIFIIYTANNCGACNKFKSNELRKIKELVSIIPNVKIIEKNLSVMGEDPGESYHPDFRKTSDHYAKWYPGFYLFNKKDFFDHGTTLNGYVIGGVFKNGKQERVPENRYSFLADDIYKWIMSIIADNKIKNMKVDIVDEDEFEYYTQDWYLLRQ